MVGADAGQGVVDGGQGPLVGDEQGQVAADPQPALDEGPLGAQLAAGDGRGGGVVGGEAQVGPGGGPGAERHLAVVDGDVPGDVAVGAAVDGLLDGEGDPGQRARPAESSAARAAGRRRSRRG